MNSGQQRHSFNGLFCFLLLMMFAGSAFLLVSLGSRIYENGVSHLDENYTIRTAIAYVSEKVRSHDEAGCISLQTLDGLPALRLEETIDGQSYYTYIYHCQGTLRELFLEAGRTPSAGMGSSLVALSEFSITETEDGFLSVKAVSAEGRSLETLLFSACQ